MRGVDLKLDAIFVYYKRLAKVRNFVEENYQNRITLECAAGIAGLESKYFSAFFHKKTGICFRQWLSGYRVNQAITRIRAQNYSITEVAYLVGFQDLRTFERAFKSHVGMTPSRFKKSVQDGMHCE